MCARGDLQVILEGVIESRKREIEGTVRRIYRSPLFRRSQA